MFARELGGQRLRNQRTAARRVAVNGDRNTNTRSAKRQAAVRRTISHSARQRIAIIRIIDAAGVMRAKIMHRVPQVLKPRDKRGL